MSLSTLMSAPNLVAAALTAVVAYTAARLVYNITLHPLRSFPGPFLCALTHLPRVSRMLGGRPHKWTQELHRIYGPVVRISPSELSILDPDAWRDIYNPATAASGSGELQGEKTSPTGWAYMPAGRAIAGMLGTPWEDHKKVRKAMAHGFSPSALRSQEETIAGYVALLMQKFDAMIPAEGGEGSAASASAKVELTSWMGFIAFDVIGRLAFGSDFSCLESGEWHPWVQILTDAAINVTQIQALDQIGLAAPLMWMMETFKVGLAARQRHERMGAERIEKRKAAGIEDAANKPDLIEGLIRAGFNDFVLQSNASLIVAGGSDTAATALAACVYLLTTHPEALRRLEAEVRGRFRSEADITMSSVNELPWMMGCLSESLRLNPPVPIAQPRTTPPGGLTVAGRRIPGGVVVGVWHWAMSRSGDYFADPDEFRPERWAERGQGRYANDRLDAVQPFVLGPRNCIGQNLANSEMRMILAHMIYNFDISLADDSKGWLDDQRVYFTWDKPPMNVHIKRVVREV